MTKYHACDKEAARSFALEFSTKKKEKQLLIAMAPVVTREMTTPVPPSELVVLEAHLPYSYSLLRRCQFTHRPGGTSDHARYLFASAAAGGGCNNNHFAAAYVDLSQGPETEVVLYSTLQDHPAEDDGIVVPPPLSLLPDQEVDHVLDLIMALFRRIRELAATAAASYTLCRPHGTMVGGLHEATYRLLVKRRGLTSSYWNPHDVWLFRLDRLSTITTTSAHPVVTSSSSSSSSSSSMRWDVVRREDIPLIASRTKIPKVEATLMSEPSVVVRHRGPGPGPGKGTDAGAGGEDKGETLVAWGFMGITGTLSTLHVEVRALSFSPSAKSEGRH